MNKGIFPHDFHDREKRTATYAVLIKWHKGGLIDLQPRGHIEHFSPHALHPCWLLGREETYRKLPMTEHEHEICAALCGPHGYAIYKAMRAKHGT